MIDDDTVLSPGSGPRPERPARGGAPGQRPPADLPPLVFPEELPDPEPVRAPVTARGVALVGFRVASAIIGVAVAGVTVAAAGLLPLPTLSTTPVGVLVTPVPTAQQLVCPGGLLRLSDESGQQATTASALGVPEVTTASATGPVSRTPIAQSDAGTGGGSAAPLVVSTPPDPADPAERVLLSGAQAQEVSEAEFVGLAAATCTPVSGQSWLVGGATTVGRTTLLTLTNPTEVAATVDLALFGENGPVTAPGTGGITVAANGQRVLSLAGFAPDLVSPVVRVTSTGGQVAASLQQSIVRGLTPGGLDIVGPTAAPATLTVIPGVVISGGADVQTLLGGGSDFDDLRSVLRLYAPGEGTVETTVRVIPEAGAGVGTSFTFELDAGRVSDVPFDELADGSYTVRVESSAPTLAAVRVSTAAPIVPPATEPTVTDVAWFGAAPELAGETQVSVPDRAGAVLHLTNPTEFPITLDVDGTPVDIAAGSSALVPVDGGSTVSISGADRYGAAVSVGAPGLLGGYPVLPAGEGSLPIRIYP